MQSSDQYRGRGNISIRKVACHHNGRYFGSMLHIVWNVVPPGERRISCIEDITPPMNRAMNQVGSRKTMHHQLAFLTPGRLPARAFIRKQYCTYIYLSPHWHVLEGVAEPGLTRAMLKSRRTPLPLPPSIHRFRICVGLVYACICDRSNCAWARIRWGRVVLRMM